MIFSTTDNNNNSNQLKDLSNLFSKVLILWKAPSLNQIELFNQYLHILESEEGRIKAKTENLCPPPTTLCLSLNIWAIMKQLKFAEQKKETELKNFIQSISISKHIQMFHKELYKTVGAS